MTAHALTTATLYVLAVIGVIVWIQRMLDAQSTPTDAQRFDGVARHLRPRKPVATRKQR